MGWLDFFKRRASRLSGNELREMLFDAAAAGDKAKFDRTCRLHRGRILHDFTTWRKAPEAVRANPEAVARYGQGLIAVAQWFSHNGAPQLWEVLQGKESDNPILHWQDRFVEADRLKTQGRFIEAIKALQDLAEDMSKCRGSAVDRLLPMVNGSLGECFFRKGDLDRAYEATRAALDGCQRGGDIDGLIVYCGNLAEICSVRGDADESRYWLILTTNAMIQTGKVEQAADLRQKHGLEPSTELIKVKGH